MSAGAFSTTRYAANDGEIYPIKLQPETLALTIDGTANDAPTGGVTIDILAKVSRRNRAYGIKPRTVTIRFTAAPPTDYLANQLYTIPCLQPAIWNAAARSTTGTYLSTACVVVGKSAESIR